MKITIYELLGLVKDGKAPKKIKYEDEIWEYSKMSEEYYSCKNGRILIGDLFFNYKIPTFINDEVEIIEEDEKIEKISWSEKESLAGDFTASKKQEILARRTEKLKASLNELIDEINKMKESDK